MSIQYSEAETTQDQNSDRALEAIREFANVGAGNAATALAAILDIELVNEVTSCTLMPLSKIAHWLGGEEQVVAGVYTQLCGDLKSGILVVFPKTSIEYMLGHMTKEKVDIAEMTLMQGSALREAGNICLCWYLVAVSRMIKTDLIPSPPDAAVDMLGAVLSLPLANLGGAVDTVIAVHTRFKGFEQDFDGYFLMLPEQQMLKEILEKLGEQGK